MGLERELYEAALTELKQSLTGVMVHKGIKFIGGPDPKIELFGYPYDERRVELAKWIVQNVWAPRED